VEAAGDERFVSHDHAPCSGVRARDDERMLETCTKLQPFSIFYFVPGDRVLLKRRDQLMAWTVLLGGELTA
jgi:hypothetical protein